MKKFAISVGAGALVVAAGATTAEAASNHVSPGCKIVSQTRTPAVYSSVNDRTGIVSVTTVEKCRGKLVTIRTSEIVIRKVG